MVHIRSCERLIRQEMWIRPRETSSVDEYIARDINFLARPVFRDALLSEMEINAAVFFEAEDVAAQPVGFAGADFGEDLVVAHGGLGEEAFVGGGNVLEIAVEEMTEKPFGDEDEGGLVAGDVHAEEGVYNDVAG